MSIIFLDFSQAQLFRGALLARGVLMRKEKVSNSRFYGRRPALCTGNAEQDEVTPSPLAGEGRGEGE